jgi:hypothetical protein
MGVSFVLSGDFAKMLRDASNNVQEDAEKILLESGKILNRYLLDEVENNNVLSDAQKELLRRDVDNKITYSSPRYVQSEAGWLFKKYDAVNPPTGVLAIWMEYGTKERTTKSGQRRGFIHPANFVRKARKRASKEINALQERMIKEGYS